MSTIREAFDTIRDTEERPFWTWDELTERYPHDLPQNAARFTTLTQLRRAVTASGSHYFDRNAVAAFDAKTDTRLYAGRFWVESRQFHDHPYEGGAYSAPREFMVAWVSEHHREGAPVFLSIEKLGSYSTLTEAREAAHALGIAVTDAEVKA